MNTLKMLLLALVLLFGHKLAAQNQRLTTSQPPVQEAVSASKFPSGRWQVGTQLVCQRFNGLTQSASYFQQAETDLNDDGSLRFFGPLVTVGFSITPRLALETGIGIASNQWRTKLQPSLIPEWWEWNKFQIRSTNWTLPLRIRYELGHTGTKRLGYYLLAGLQLVQQNTYYRSEPTAANPDPAETGWSIHRDVPVVLGLGLRYRVAKHLALTADGQFAASPRFLFDGTYQGVNTATPGAGASLGLRYGF